MSDLNFIFDKYTTVKLCDDDPEIPKADRPNAPEAF